MLLQEAEQTAMAAKKTELYSNLPLIDHEKLIGLGHRCPSIRMRSALASNSAQHVQQQRYFRCKHQLKPVQGWMSLVHACIWGITVAS